MGKVRQLRVGVIGCGAIGSIHAKAIRDSRQASLSAVCDPELPRARKAAAGCAARIFGDYQIMLRETPLDIVTVATPDAVHVKPTLSALSRGLHVFCEKPLAGTVAEALRLIRAARTQGVQLGVNYNRRFAFGYQKAKQLLNEGHIGRVRHAAFHISDGMPLRVAGEPHALLTSLLSHHFDLLRFLCGEIVSVQAVFRGQAQDKPHDVCLAMRLASQAVASITAGWRSGQGRTVEHFRVAGSKGVMTVDDVQRSVTLWQMSPDSMERFQPDSFGSGNRFHDSITAHLQAFLAAIAAGKRVPITAEDGLAGLRLIGATIAANRGCHRVNIPSANQFCSS